jgi:LPS export ABC transporter protein LptC
MSSIFKIHHFFINPALLFCTAGFLFSCVNDLDSVQKVTFSSKAPNESIKNLHVIISEEGYAQVELFASLAETFQGKEHVTKLKDNLKVNFLDNKGQIVSTLTALNGVINYTNGTLLVKDSVRLFNYEKNQTLETEALFWNQRDSSIYSLSQVIIRTPKGKVIGSGVRTKQDFARYELLKPEGVIELEKQLTLD